MQPRPLKGSSHRPPPVPLTRLAAGRRAKPSLLRCSPPQWLLKPSDLVARRRGEGRGFKRRDSEAKRASDGRKGRKGVDQEKSEKRKNVWLRASLTGCATSRSTYYRGARLIIWVDYGWNLLSFYGAATEPLEAGAPRSRSGLRRWPRELLASGVAPRWLLASPRWIPPSAGESESRCVARCSRKLRSAARRSSRT